MLTHRLPLPRIQPKPKLAQVIQLRVRQVDPDDMPEEKPDGVLLVVPFGGPREARRSTRAEIEMVRQEEIRRWRR